MVDHLGYDNYVISRMSAEVQLFHQLESFYTALAGSVLDPLMIPKSENGKSNAPKRGAFFSTFYAKDEDGWEIVQERIDRERDVISHYLQVHANLMKGFKAVEHAHESEQRGDLEASIAELTRHGKQLGDLISKHHQQHPEYVFLFWPTINSREIGVRGGRVFPLTFNKNQTQRDMVYSMFQLQCLMHDFIHSGKPFSKQTIVTTPHDVETISLNGSYRENVLFTAEELGKIGLSMKKDIGD